MVGQAWAAGARDPETYRDTLTPIKHLIILIGENHSFDNVFGTYRPNPGQTIANLLSRRIVNDDGSPGPNAAAASQFVVDLLPSNYFMGANFIKAMHSPYLPTPELDGAPNIQAHARPPFDNTISQPQLANLEPALELQTLGLLRTGTTGAAGTSGPDTRVPGYATLPNTVFQLTGPSLSYNSYTGDTVHRFYQMWQQSDCNVKNATPDNPSGCLNDLYSYVGVQQGDHSGGNSMGFFNMLQGDASMLSKLADAYTLSDNFHQAIMGGTAANHVALGSGDAIYWTTFDGMSTPPAGTVANPDPQSSTSNKYKVDREWSNCSVSSQPGVSAIANYLSTLPYHPDRRCQIGRFYMLNNLGPGYLPNGRIDAASILAGNRVPPSPIRTIGDALNENCISWAYYGGGYNTAVRIANGSSDPLDISAYCEACNFAAYTMSIMNNPAQRAQHIKDVTDFFAALESRRLPAVAFVKPDGFVDGHPATSKLVLFEAVVENIVKKLTADLALFSSTALFVMLDEAGGYWDSGYIQPLDFFGDGPRIPFIVVSPYSRGGRVVHSYNDHVSVLKFIERNWRLQPLTGRSRDNLPNPISADANPYVPLNPPAIGDLLDMFDFRPPGG